MVNKIYTVVHRGNWASCGVLGIKRRTTRGRSRSLVRVDNALEEGTPARLTSDGDGVTLKHCLVRSGAPRIFAYSLLSRTFDMQMISP